MVPRAAYPFAELEVVLGEEAQELAETNISHSPKEANREKPGEFMKHMPNVQYA